MAKALGWVIKPSLVEYLRDAGGEIRGLDGALIDGEVAVFPASPTAGQFQGTVTLHAHGGMMDWAVVNPRLDDSGLWIDGDQGAPLLFATVAETGGLSLTEPGARHFGSIYGAGSPMGSLAWVTQ